MRNRLVDIGTDTDAARWPIVDRLIELNDAGRIEAEVWHLILSLAAEYEAEVAALRERPAS